MNEQERARAFKRHMEKKDENVIKIDLDTKVERADSDKIARPSDVNDILDLLNINEDKDEFRRERERSKRRAIMREEKQKEAIRMRRKEQALIIIAVLAVILVTVILLTMISRAFGSKSSKKDNKTSTESTALVSTKEMSTEETVPESTTETYIDASAFVYPDWIKQEFIEVSPYSRPGKALKKVNNIVLHYIGNAGTTAEQNRSYFNGLAELKDENQKASSHFVVGLEGEIVQCVPLTEISYCSNHRNSDTVSIESCHPTADGQYTQATYDSTVKLTAWLCTQYGLTKDDVIRHYDVTGKNCPLYYVKNPDAWEQLKNDIGAKIEEMKSESAY